VISQNKGFWQLGPDGTVNASGGGGATAWEPITGMTLGGMTRVDNYITSVTEGAPGQYTCGLDLTVNRTTLGTGDRWPVDLITDWAANGSTTHVLQVRITYVSVPSDLSGAHWIGIYHDNGSFPGSGGAAGLISLISATKRSFESVGGLGTGIVEGNALGASTDTFVFTFIPPVGSINGRYLVSGHAENTSETTSRYGFTELSLASVNTATIDAGYDVGCHTAFSFQQRVASTGTDSITFKLERRYVPLFG
jgi:hypothetical protein